MGAAVVGAGTMGIGIAHGLVTTGTPAILVERDEWARAQAADRISAVIDKGVERGRLDPGVAAEAKARLTVVATVDELPEGLDLVIEAIPELLDAKLATLAAIERRAPRHLASNTSSFSIDRLATGLADPTRFVGMHFFNPVWSMDLVEVVVGTATGPDTLEAARSCVARLGKQAITVRDSPGFATSRLGVIIGLEAIRMVEEGVASPEDIDTGMVLGYGYPMGPLRLGDLVGLDVRLDIAHHLAETLGERFRPPALLERMVAEGKLGKKTGQGFYPW